MATLRKVASMLAGGTQCILGGLSLALAFLVFASQSARDALFVEPREVPLFMFLLSAFGMLLILSGLLLVWGRDGRF
jgi:hypothetical protein